MSRWKPYSFDGLVIAQSPGSDFAAILGEGFTAPAEVVVGTVERSHLHPVPRNRSIGTKIFALTVVCRGNMLTQKDTLMQTFDTLSDEQKRLIVFDNQGGEYWYVDCHLTRLQARRGPAFTFMLQAVDPFFTSVVETVETWPVTTQPDTFQFTVGGNLPAKPVMKIQANAAKTTGFAFSQFVQMRHQNPGSVRADWLDLGNAAFNGAALVADTSKSNQINQGGGINASVTTIPVDTAVGGGLPATGGRAYVDSEQIRYTANSGTQLTGVTRGINGTTAASHADNAVIKISRVAADGRDFRVYVKGKEVPRYLVNFNSAAAKIWIWGVNTPTNDAVTLKTAIDADDVVVVLSKPLAPTFAAQSREVYPEIFKIGTELIAAKIVSVAGTTITLTGVIRGYQGTTPASHSVGDAVYFLPMHIEFMYGNDSLSTPAYLASEGATLDLSSSTNAAFVYTLFQYLSSPRRTSWYSQIITSFPLSSAHYYGDLDTAADPATAAGIKAFAYYSAGWKAGSVSLQWRCYTPYYVKNFSVAGKKFKTVVTGGWPTICRFETGLTGGGYETLFNIVAPSVINTWEDITSGTVTPVSTTMYWLDFYMSGSIAASANNIARAEIQSITINFDATRVPVFAYNTAVAIYEFDATITDTDRSESIAVAQNTFLDTDIEIDFESKLVTVLETTPRSSTVTPDGIRFDWLTFEPGVKHLSYLDVGTTDVTVLITYKKRHTF